MGCGTSFVKYVLFFFNLVFAVSSLQSGRRGGVRNRFGESRFRTARDAAARGEIATDHAARPAPALLSVTYDLMLPDLYKNHNRLKKSPSASWTRAQRSPRDAILCADASTSHALATKIASHSLRLHYKEKDEANAGKTNLLFLMTSPASVLTPFKDKRIPLAARERH
ncbi:hypothetical protein EVAR_74964_1 [Eumeta japonica]|uniref:Uncharacterized protein n=1 Tax=Eumeta variegata TaxID=151549 RepID=A0A4C1UIA5_EUMVA|nr:hypothetical protein EVAR_74964_1 [Eumeta japonica]